MKEKELVKLRKKVYQLLKVNDATNKVSWWNLADDVVDLIEEERERVIEECLGAIGTNDKILTREKLSVAKIRVTRNKMRQEIRDRINKLKKK